MNLKNALNYQTRQTAWIILRDTQAQKWLSLASVPVFPPSGLTAHCKRWEPGVKGAENLPCCCIEKHRGRSQAKRFIAWKILQLCLLVEPGGNCLRTAWTPSLSSMPWGWYCSTLSLWKIDCMTTQYVGRYFSLIFHASIKVLCVWFENWWCHVSMVEHSNVALCSGVLPSHTKLNWYHARTFTANFTTLAAKRCNCNLLRPPS